MAMLAITFYWYIFKIWLFENSQNKDQITLIYDAKLDIK